NYLDTLPEAVSDEADEPTDNDLVFSVASPFCGLNAQLALTGSMDAAKLTLHGYGQDLALEAAANLAPQAGFPLRDAEVNLMLADASSLHATVAWTELEALPGEAIIRDRVQGTLNVNQLDIGQLAMGALPTAIISTQGEFVVLLQNREL